MRTDGFAAWTLIVSLGFLTSACGEPARGPERAPSPDGWRAFEGSESSTGRIQLLDLGPGRRVAILNMTGSLVVGGGGSLGVGFRTETIGYSDNVGGGRAWTVWTDSRGDKVFSEIRGEPVGTGARFTGTLLGGTGRYAGVTGDYRFAWKYVVGTEDGTIQGRSTDLRGRFRRGPP